MISAAECRQHIEPHLETQTICDHRLHCPPCPPMAFWNRAGVGCFWLTYDPQKQFPSLEVRLTMSCSALWAVDLGWSDQDTFQAGTFGGFLTSRLALAALSSYWIIDGKSVPLVTQGPNWPLRCLDCLHLLIYFLVISYMLMLTLVTPSVVVSGNLEVHSVHSVKSLSLTHKKAGPPKISTRS